MEKKLYTLGLLNTRHFTAYLDEVTLRTGKTSRRLKIDHPEAVAIVPFVDPQHILMVRQWRYAVETETLEIPAGKVDPGETIEEAIQRELMEETGYRATTIKPLISYFPAIAYSNEIIHIFSAEILIASHRRFDEDEISAVEVVSIKDAMKMVKNGLIRDGKTIIGILCINLAI
ncbi:MAG: NUDIX hydrolase [Syntrophobacterales bacterium]|nr:NUDIX hydrolase [Syntrophobacterales bacterium]